VVKERKIRLKHFNWLLVFIILAINLYVLVSPLLPQIDLWRRKQEAAAVAGLPYKTNLDSSSKKDDMRAEIPSDNRLVIPKLALDEHIYTGSSPYLVNKGVWARPNTSTPPKDSNTVLVGHRFTYGGPATFYSLDKVAVGDKLVLYWQGKEYDYTVTSTKVVAPTAIEVEEPTKQPQLTVYTCTPIWSAKDRLVVVAKLDEPSQP